MRGPAIVPTVAGRPERPTARERFDDLALGIVMEIDQRWQDRLGLVEYAVEDTPQIPDDWTSGTVPLSSLVRGSGATPTRLTDDHGAYSDPVVGPDGTVYALRSSVDAPPAPVRIGPAGVPVPLPPPAPETAPAGPRPLSLAEYLDQRGRT